MQGAASGCVPHQGRVRMIWSSEAFFVSAIESSIDCVMVLDLEGRLIFMNEAGRRLLELEDFGRVRGRHWLGFWPATARGEIRAAVEAARRGETVRLQADCPTARGAPKTWDVTAAPLKDVNGEVKALLCNARDITELVVRERDLARAASALRLASRIAGVGGWEYDCATGQIRLSPELLSLLDASSEPAPGRGVELLWIEEERAAFRAAFEATLRTGERLDFEGRVHSRAGERWMRVLGEADMVEGRCVAVRGASQDVSDWRQAMERLRTSERQAQAAAEAMASFLATMSHEIRTPLNGVLGMAEAMELGELAPSQRDRLKVIQESGRALLTLLNDLLDLSRIQEGQIQLEDGAIVVEELCAGARATFEALVRDKDVVLVIDIDEAARGAWRGDPTRVRQIVTNLLSNAVKFTERGQVRLALNHDGANLVIQVEDTGVGIPPDRLPHVFDRFVQADASTTRRYGGSGLGLAICRELVELMNGHVFAESRAGSGSTFTFSFPTQPTEAAFVSSDDVATRTAGSAAFALRILAAEDNATNRMVLSALLGELGCHLSVAHNGAEALAAFRTGAWDVVLLDIQMPVMDGVTAMRLMREEESASGRRRTPILALTANAMEHQKAQYLAAGADGLVAKPISLAGLVNALEAVLTEAADGPAAAVG